MTAGYDISPISLDPLTDALVADLNRFGNDVKQQIRPEDPPTPLNITRASLENIPSFVSLRMFGARDAAGALIGQATIVVARTEDNQHMAQTSVHVLPDHRRQGVATRLVAELIPIAEEEQRRLIVAESNEAIPAGALMLESIGATSAMETHVNQLELVELDRDLVALWISGAPEASKGYSIDWLDGPAPDDRIDEVVAMQLLMNTQPFDELEIEDFQITPEILREGDKQLVATGTERWMLMAREGSTGRAVGFTETYWSPANPKVVGQGGTAVDPEHRGHKLGKWLKAAMLQRVLDERPDVTQVRTGNADSNDAMLSINRQLGFKPHRADAAWQVETETVKDWLKART